METQNKTSYSEDELEEFPSRPDMPSLWKQHWIKSISIVLLIVILSALWYHKKTGRDLISHQPPIIKNEATTPKAISPAPTPVKMPVQTAEQVLSLSSPATSKTPVYTIQFIGSHEIKKVKSFIADHRLQKTTHIVATKYHGKPWYIVTMGPFKNKKAAHQAQEALPVSLKKLHPWIRKSF